MLRHYPFIRQIIVWLSIAIICCSGMLLFLKPMWQSGFTYLPGDAGDTLLNNYFLEHSYQKIANPEYKIPWWSPSFFYPEKLTLAYSDTLWGTAPIYWIGRSFLSVVHAYQFWIVSLILLNFISFYIVARGYSIHWFFSAIGAFLFAFGLPRSMQNTHLQLLPECYSLFALYFFHRYFKNQKLFDFILWELCLVLQFLAGAYLGIFLLLTFVFLIPIYYFFYGKNSAFIKKAFSPPYILVSIVIGTLGVASVIPYFVTASRIGYRSYEAVIEMLPQLRSYFTISPDALFYSYYPHYIQTIGIDLPFHHEHFLFFGFSVLIIFVVSVFVWLRYRHTNNHPLPPIVVIAFFAFFSLFLISLYISSINKSLWYIVYKIFPGANALRSVSRIWTISYIFLFLSVVAFAQQAYTVTKSITVKVIIILLCIVMCFENINEKPKFFDVVKTNQTQITLETLIRSTLRNQKVDAFYVSWPTNELFYEYQIKAMWASLDLNIPTINGYSGKQPIYYKDISISYDAREIKSWLNHYQFSSKQRILFIKLGLDSNKNLEIVESTIIEK